MPFCPAVDLKYNADGVIETIDAGVPLLPCFATPYEVVPSENTVFVHKYLPSATATTIFDHVPVGAVVADAPSWYWIDDTVTDEPGSPGSPFPPCFSFFL